MNRYEAQGALFAKRPARMALLAVPSEGINDPALRQPVRINVWRNHAIEPVMALAQPYFAWAGLGPRVRVGHYDDTLRFAGHEEADIELVWIDPTRYGNQADWHGWLADRLLALRSLTNVPILLATWSVEEDPARLQALADSIPGVRFADLHEAAREIDVPLLDPRTAVASGTPISGALQAPLARKLVCHWFSACVAPRVKAVAVDLDNTLHAGVLGEDGVHGVVITPGHVALQQALKGLQARGVFLALVSRNDLSDVKALFNDRPDYPLRWLDFTACEVSWGNKADALRSIARHLNIDTSAIVFVDDNLGELLNVVIAIPEMRTVFAETDAGLTSRAMLHVPGLWRWKSGPDDAVRIADLQANLQRRALRRSGSDPSDYFRELKVELQWRVDPVDQLERLADLCGKTNQFNLSLCRYRHAELWQFMQSASAHVVSVKMQDRLSDSGVVGVIVARRDGSRLIVEEACISCRALGRGLEDWMLVAVIRRLPLFEGCTHVVFRAVHGPRNEPALRWLATLMGHGPAVTLPAEGEYALPSEKIAAFTPPPGLVMYSEDELHAT